MSKRPCKRMKTGNNQIPTNDESLYHFEQEFNMFRQTLSLLCDLRLENTYQKIRFKNSIDTKLEELRGDRNIMFRINQSSRDIDFKIIMLEALKRTLE